MLGSADALNVCCSPAYFVRETRFALEVFVTVKYPLFEPVTRTLIRFPRSFRVSLYFDFVAPLIAFPLRSHRYFSVTLAGFHVPGLTASFFPTFAVPLIFGFGVAVNFFATVYCNVRIVSLPATSTARSLTRC